MSNEHNQQKLSSARFSESTDAFVEAFTASIQFDQRMYKQDIQGSIAHAKMISKVGILSETELRDVLTGLQQVQDEIEAAEFNWSIQQEDIHMNIEARLTSLIGITGKNCIPVALVMTRSQRIFACLFVMKLMPFCLR